MQTTKRISPLPPTLDWHDLYTPAGLQKIDALFQEYLISNDIALGSEYQELRAKSGPKNIPPAQLVDLAKQLNAFLIQFFDIAESVDHVSEVFVRYKAQFQVKRDFMRRRVLARFPTYESVPYQYRQATPKEMWDFLRPFMKSGGAHFTVEEFVVQVGAWLQNPEENVEALAAAILYAAWAVQTPIGQAYHAKTPLFHLPKPIDWTALISTKTVDRSSRQGFDLTDPGMSLKAAADQAHYCLVCHHRGKDTCRTGFKAPKGAPEEHVKNPIGNSLSGCPLDQKISEMNALLQDGYVLGSLAVVIIDNPMVGGTGHRICNDCMKGCIFQKQEPVDVPQIETRLLKEVLKLPWGFEIYGLLTRWNPLNIARPLPEGPQNKAVLVVGMGPAGYTMAHYLLQGGYDVCGIDGLKIEPLSSSLLPEKDGEGNIMSINPIRDFMALHSPLSERIGEGFGGVAEYGITARWDKNFLKAIRLLLQRRERFVLQGGVRFGSTLTVDDLVAGQISHVVLATGAGRPKIVETNEILAKGVRQAVDFLMQLHLGGSAHTKAAGRTMLQLPVVVVGAGLTAVDAATEALAYYPGQCALFHGIYQRLLKRYGKAKVEADWDESDHQLAAKLLAHHDLFCGASTYQEKLDIINRLGGVHLIYRNRIEKAPSYRLNHHELQNAINEGVQVHTDLQFKNVDIDGEGWVQNALFEHKSRKESVVFPAKTVLLAMGTHANTTLTDDVPYLKESNGFYVFEDQQRFQLLTEGSPLSMTAIGDLHPDYHGSVVKAMASAKKAFPYVVQHLEKALPKNQQRYHHFVQLLKTIPQIHEITPLNESRDKGVRMTVHAPLHARHYKAGQYYKVQPFHGERAMTDNQLKHVPFYGEGVPLAPVACDKKKGLLVFEIYGVGASSKILTRMEIGALLYIMGPIGDPLRFERDQPIVLLGAQNHPSVKSILHFLHQEGQPVEVVETSQDFEKMQEDETTQAVYLIDESVFPKETHKQIRHLYPNATIYEGVHGPLQCMMKGVCAQCLQWIYDPRKKSHNIGFACAARFQPLRPRHEGGEEHQKASMPTIVNRLNQNTLHEKLLRLYVDEEEGRGS